MEMEQARKRKRHEADNGAGEDSEATVDHVKTKLDRQEVHFVRGEMQYLFDEQGQKYLDISNSTQLVGHCHPTVVAAGAKQMAELNTNTRFLNDRMIKFAEKLTSTLPDKLTLCYFVNSRSEANDLALQIAEVATGHTQCISLAGCYHGHLQSLRTLCKDTASSSCIAPTPDVYRGIHCDPETAGMEYGNEIQKIIDHQLSENNTISSFIHETIMTKAGMISLPNNFLKETYKHVRAAGGVCIADEMDTGFGRLGDKFWGFELHGVCPDIVTMGTSMGNGHPVGVVITTKIIADKFALGCSYFNTFGGNPVSMTIARSVLSVIENESLQNNASQVGGYLLNQLRLLQDKHECIGDIRGQGLCIGIDIVANRVTKEPASDTAQQIATSLLREHHIVCQVDGSVIKVKPPLCITMESAKEFISAIDVILTNYSPINANTHARTVKSDLKRAYSKY